MGQMAQLMARAKIKERAILEALPLEERLKEINKEYLKEIKWIWEKSKINLFNNWINKTEDLRGKTKEDLFKLWLNAPWINNILNYFKELEVKENAERIRKLEEDWLDNKLPEWEISEIDTTDKIVVNNTNNKK